MCLCRHAREGIGGVTFVSFSWLEKVAQARARRYGQLFLRDCPLCLPCICPQALYCSQCRVGVAFEFSAQLIVCLCVFASIRILNLNFGMVCSGLTNPESGICWCHQSCLDTSVIAHMSQKTPVFESFCHQSKQRPKLNVMLACQYCWCLNKTSQAPSTLTETESNH